MVADPKPEWRDGVPWCSQYYGTKVDCVHREPADTENNSGECDDETFCAPAVNRLVSALCDSRSAVQSLTIDALGSGRDGEMDWSLRDELVDKITAALPPEDKNP